MGAAIDAALAERFIGGRRGSSPERALWCTVLQIAVEEAAKSGDFGWFGTRWSEIVCDLAGLDRDAVVHGLRSRQAA
jgi:hypothetical protein